MFQSFRPGTLSTSSLLYIANRDNQGGDKKVHVMIRVSQVDSSIVESGHGNCYKIDCQAKTKQQNDRIRPKCVSMQRRCTERMNITELQLMT